MRHIPFVSIIDTKSFVTQMNVNAGMFVMLKTVICSPGLYLGLITLSVIAGYFYFVLMTPQRLSGLIADMAVFIEQHFHLLHS